MTKAFSKNFLSNFLPKPEEKIEATLPDLGKNLITNLREWLPPSAFTFVDEYAKSIQESTHKIECQLDLEAKQGQALQCARGKRELKYQQQLQKERIKNRPKFLKENSRTIKFKNKDRGLIGKSSGTDKIRLNQNSTSRSYLDRNTRFKVNPSEANKQFDPNNPGSSFGDRAVLFDANGKVLRTAQEINEEGRAIDESAKSADKPVRATPRKRNPKTELKNLSDAIQKTKGSGKISGLRSLFAAVMGLVAIACLLALLVPLSFLTVALNWLQTVTTMLTNIKDVGTTYLSIAEAGLSLFGYPKLKSKINEAVNGIAYGLFGKENYEEAKAQFAQGILNLTSMTKLLEKIEAARNGTNSKIDAVAFSLGVTNNSLKDAGMIPPDSPWMQYSESVDKFVDAQAKISTDPDLKENIEKLTEEIKTNEEIDKEIKEEKEAKEKLQQQKQKELDNLKELGENVKPLIEKQIQDAQE